MNPTRRMYRYKYCPDNDVNMGGLMCLSGYFSWRNYCRIYSHEIWHSKSLICSKRTSKPVSVQNWKQPIWNICTPNWSTSFYCFLILTFHLCLYFQKRFSIQNFIYIPWFSYAKPIILGLIIITIGKSWHFEVTHWRFLTFLPWIFISEIMARIIHQCIWYSFSDKHFGII